MYGIYIKTRDAGGRVEKRKEVAGSMQVAGEGSVPPFPACLLQAACRAGMAWFL